MLLKSDLDAKQTHLWGRFVEQKLALSSSFRCDQIYKIRRYDFGHTLLCYLSQTYVKQTHLWGWFVEQKLALSSSFWGDQIHY